MEHSKKINDITYLSELTLDIKDVKCQFAPPTAGLNENEKKNSQENRLRR